MTLNLDECLKNNIHNRSEADIRKCIGEWTNTPLHYIRLDCTPLLQGDAKKESGKIEKTAENIGGSNSGTKLNFTDDNSLDLISDEDSQMQDVSVQRIFFSNLINLNLFFADQ